MALDNKPYLVEDLNENLADDPYSTATYIIRRVLEDALDDGVSGTMSQREYDNLTAIAMNFVDVTGESIDPRPA